MPEPLRTEVHFRTTGFNTTEPREYFINPCCYGDDLCRWLIAQLRARGIEAEEEPGQEDFGWYLSFHAGGVMHTFVVGYSEEGPTSEGFWRGWLERDAGFIASILGARKRGISSEAADSIHAVLSASTRVRDLTWHFPGDDGNGATTPTG
jgi:hypothetical protein